MIQYLITKFLGMSTTALVSNMVWVAKLSTSFVYPLFRSARIARGKEADENKIRLLKFW